MGSSIGSTNGMFCTCGCAWEGVCGQIEHESFSKIMLLVKVNSNDKNACIPVYYWYIVMQVYLFINYILVIRLRSKYIA